MPQDERLTIGDDVPLVVDGGFGNEMEEVSLDLDSVEPSGDSGIDLGIEELVI